MKSLKLAFTVGNMHDSYTKAKDDLSKALKLLDDHLLSRTYFVGNSITLADIVIASALLYPFKLVADKTYLKPFPNVMRWFNTCVSQPEFIRVVGNVQLCKKEILADGHKSSGKGKTKERPAAAAPSPAAAPTPAPKKPEHPYKIMDKEAPSEFIMDAWKKTYSNASSYDEAMKIFWDTFDEKGWSLWLQAYNYNEDNKKIFMVSNAVGGFQQRTDEIRKWAFGVMDVSIISGASWESRQRTGRAPSVPSFPMNGH